MQVGAAGVCQAVHVGRTGVGLLGTGGTNLKGMTGYRRLMYSRRYHDGLKTLRLRQSKKNPVEQQLKSSGNPGPSGGANTRAGRWSLLVFLVGPGRHVQALKEIVELTQVLLRLVARQFEVHTAERIRRGLQLYSAYSRLWGEEAARALLNNLRRTLVARGRHLLLSAVCFSNYDWESNKISDEALKSAIVDLESVEDLCRATVQCDNCGKRQVIDQQMADIDYCVCEGHLGYTNTSRVYDSWEPFIERTHHIVWRKKHEVHQHLYAYKVYGTYDDVCLSAFMEVQLNSDFRTQWDDTALQLRVLDSQPDSNSDLIYWLVKYPHFFANRDYIYKRRFLWNEEKQEAVIMNEAVSLDKVPEEKGIHRVDEYWSVMVIRAKEDASKPGLEYTLTYFDNPGTSLPQWLTNFIAVTGFPSFLQKVHEAAVSLQAIHKQGKDVYISLPEELRYPGKRVVEKPSDLEVIPTKDIIPVEVPELIDDRKISESQLSLVDHDLLEEDSSSMKISSHKESLHHEMEELTENKDSSLSTVVTVDIIKSEKIHSDVDQVPEDKSKSNKTVLPEDLVNQKILLHTETEIAQDERTALEEVKPFYDVRDEMVTSDSESFSGTDKSINVHLGDKEVKVDILEAMEITAPDLDKQTALTKNVEKLTAKALEELGDKSVLIEKMEKLRQKLKLFQLYAHQRKENSLRKMEELENRTHYEHTDDQTQRHLEKLFNAMREVLKADKEMRTGKGLMSSEGDIILSKNENNQGMKMGAETKEGNKSEMVLSEKVSDASSSPAESSEKNDHIKSQRKTDSPSEPPPPPPPPPEPPSSQVPDADMESRNIHEITGSEVETYNGIDCIKEESQPNINYMWAKSFISLLYLMRWWESAVKDALVENKEAVGVTQINSLEERENKGGAETTSVSIADHVWYVVRLGWLFQSKSEGQIDMHIVREESPVSRYSSKTEKEEDQSWLWYPVNGAYRLYSWAFRSSRENA